MVYINEDKSYMDNMCFTHKSFEEDGYVKWTEVIEKKLSK